MFTSVAASISHFPTVATKFSCCTSNKKIMSPLFFLSLALALRFSFSRWASSACRLLSLFFSFSIFQKFWPSSLRFSAKIEDPYSKVFACILKIFATIFMKIFVKSSKILARSLKILKNSSFFKKFAWSPSKFLNGRIGMDPCKRTNITAAAYEKLQVSRVRQHTNSLGIAYLFRISLILVSKTACTKW